jgi:hypothetical protein
MLLLTVFRKVDLIVSFSFLLMSKVSFVIWLYTKHIPCSVLATMKSFLSTTISDICLKFVFTLSSWWF